jgi:ABC-type transporter Mla subunit MlaD
MQEAQLRAQHTAELDAVHARLQEVLARKDEANQQLRAQLNATLAQLQQATRELMGDDE